MTTTLPETSRPIGPTVLKEWLMVDVRVARRVGQQSKLWSICKSLGDRGGCGVIDGTLVIDLLSASSADRAYVLDLSNWPTA